MHTPLPDDASLRSYLLAIAERSLDTDLRPKASASDLVQQTLLLAHRFGAGRRAATPEEHRGWLRRILLATLSNLRRSFARQRRRLSLERPTDGDALPCPQESPSWQASRAEQHDRLRAALARLPDHYLRVVTWRAEEGRDFAEIGRRLGVSEDAARMTWNRALLRLRDLLGDSSCSPTSRP